ncbi:unnamed protein product [Trifolium pratense]|uniref:Uncharacterized protein n=1 Tax=Trifolium pratense TaxID=57577 RepID=A0ACB0MDI0_TRIPR|nr:unnamed protein product [Trifolium pratense]
MEILSSLRISETTLATLVLVLLFSIPTQAQEYILSKQKPTQHALSVSQIGKASKMINPYDSILEFLNSSSFPNRTSFSHDFLFGTGTSALQIEGGLHEGGRGLGLYLDAAKFPSKIEHYKRYKEDVQHLKKLGINSYRMSISWSRVLPDGTLKGGINQEGINFYNNLINELLENGIEPFVGIMHADYPLALNQKLGGFSNRSIVKHYKDYSELLFKTYGDRVKHWITVNEIEVTSLFTFMLSRDPLSTDQACQNTKICTQVYTVFHNLLISHATTSELYRTKFQTIQRGEIGLSLSSGRYVPYSSKSEDVVAAQRLMDFYWGWVLDPIFHGDYPKIMKKIVGNRLPKFTEKEKHMLKGSTDFIGVNYYTSHFARHEQNRTNVMFDNYDALAVSEVFNAEGKTLGYKDQYSMDYVYPEGLYNVLIYIKKKYNNPKIYITENGITSTKIPNPLNDEHRTAYIAAHINATKAAIDDGVNVQGYFVWSAFDTFEFQMGYSAHWGLYHIDFNDSLKRIPTDAAKWYTKYLTCDLGH